jgi:hypothetical protein
LEKARLNKEEIRMDQQNQSGKIALNIVSKKVEHKGFGAGTIDLSNVSAVIIDGEEAYFDLGALHAKSKVEKGIKFSMDKAEVPNGRTCWIVWVAVDRAAEGSHYAGLAACEMSIDEEARRGWKILADHVNRMDKAMKRHVLIDNLAPADRLRLKDALIANNAELWERAPEGVKGAFEA